MKEEIREVMNVGNATRVTVESFRGPAGFSPTIDVTQVDGEAILTITDRNGTRQVNIQRGADGEKDSL